MNYIINQFESFAIGEVFKKDWIVFDILRRFTEYVPLQSQIGRLKDQIERLTIECDSARVKESQAVEQSRRTGRQLREVREDLATLQQKHTDAVSKKGEVEKQMELAESEVITLKSDLKLAFKRIEDLQQAIQGDLNDSDSDLSDR